MNYNWTSAISFLWTFKCPRWWDERIKETKMKRGNVSFIFSVVKPLIASRNIILHLSLSVSRSLSLSFFSSLLYVRPQNNTANEKTFPSKLSSRNRENDFTVHKRNLIYSPQGWNEGTRVTLNDYQYIKKKRVNTLRDHNCCAPN